jgi:hypothetical protein
MASLEGWMREELQSSRVIMTWHTQWITF